MVKRLSDSEIWDKDWFLDLPDKKKLLVKFLYDKCDCAGIYEISKRVLRTCFFEDIKKEDFEGLKQIRFINENTIFIEDFIKFQYKTEIPYLNPSNGVHRGILRRLKKYNLDTLTVPLPKSTGIGIGIGIGNNTISINNKNEEKEKFSKITNPDFYISDDKNKIFELYQNECPNLIKITAEKRSRKILDKVSNFLSEINYDWEYFKNLCRSANDLKTIANTKIDFEMMLNCHIGIMNGKYKKDQNKKGVSQEFIDDFFENLRKEESQNE